MEILMHKHVKTRKEHHCFGCGEKCPKGTILLFQKNLVDGDFSNIYMCNLCDKVFAIWNTEAYHEVQDGVLEGSIKEHDYWESMKNIVPRVLLEAPKKVTI